ncbi:ATP-binding protein [Niveibacterium sp. 24ML]|uniref:AAA family ATPase n=1 Tax=Niveibacterium sp. 24ML TaxID=2985512 RepID=UPI00226E441C|nr:ATP-binding protein [Niveibacterium sp. 24ML]MCX9157274.1 ATP-binding protein [Niveibacterium sp. 24ML]
MLTAFTLRMFKSYRESRLPLGPLTVLIGANAAGKSNALEGLRLLSWLAQGQRLSAIQYEVNRAHRVVRGRVDDLFFRLEPTLEIGCDTDDADWNQLRMRLTLREGELHIAGEQISNASGGVRLYDLDQPAQGLGSDAGVAYNNFARGPNKPHITCNDQTAVFLQLTSPASFSTQKAQQTIPAVAKNYERLLSSILFLDPAPAQMRDYSFASERRLLGDGTNLSSVLHHLCSDPQNKADVLSFIQSLPEQDIQDIEFLTGPRGELMVQLVETFGGHAMSYDATLLSDGTLRVLAIAAAMLSAQEGSLVVIEEIDNGVHPSRARHLLERIRAIAERRKLRVLLSTHNPAMLDALPDPAVPDVVFCYRDATSGASCLTRMQDIPDMPELLAQGSLGHLMTSGLLERFVKHHPGAEEKKRQALAWFDALQGDTGEARQ